MDLKFKLFADCIPIKGYKRAVIYDLNRKKYVYIPNSMVEFIEEAEGESKADIIKKYGEVNVDLVQDYINFLEENEFVFWIPPLIASNFENLNKNWDDASQITNAILDIDAKTSYNLNNALEQLQNLGCKHIILRNFSIGSIEFYNQLLVPFLASSYLSIEIITEYDNTIKENLVNEFLNSHKRVKAIIFHSAPINKIINEKKDLSMGNIAYTQQKILSPNDCYHNSIEYFNTCVKLFTEAQLHHSYYNRKVAIDAEGNIKNCASHDIKYGNVNAHKIADIIATSEFQKLWFVKKDDTEVCKDCEFRYMCVDSRLPKQKEDGTWYHEIECNYNPYIAKWKGEMDYISLEECGVVS